MQKCPGEAHSNAHIDNCGMCSPRWGDYHACPTCLTRLDRRSQTMGSARCLNGECPDFNSDFSIV